MTSLATRLDQIQAEQKRQGELLEKIFTLIVEEGVLSPEDLDHLLAKGMEMAERRSLTAGMAQNNDSGTPS